MKKFMMTLIFAGSLAMYGCDQGTSVPSGGSSSPAPSAQPEKSETESPSGETVKKADVGATGKGQFADSAEKPMSIITVPLASYFAAKEMAVFRIQIPEALKLFKAANGRDPESEKEFMEQIIKANNIALPKLKPGDTYTYDVKGVTLMVKSKK